MRFYVGHVKGKMFGEVFKAATMPTRASHGKEYFATTGPFRTKRGAEFMANQYNNPHCQTVADAERIAKSLAK